MKCFTLVNVAIILTIIAESAVSHSNDNIRLLKTFDSELMNQAQAQTTDITFSQFVSFKRRRRSILKFGGGANGLELGTSTTRQRATGQIVSNIENSESKTVVQVVNYTIPNWEEMLDNEFDYSLVDFETSTTFNLTARWRILLQETNGKLAFFLALMSSNQNPVWATYNVQILKADGTPSTLRFSYRYPINRYGHGTDQRRAWGWSLPEIRQIEDPVENIISQNKLTLLVTVTTYGKGHRLYGNGGGSSADTPGVAAATQSRTLAQDYPSIANFLETMNRNAIFSLLEVKRVRVPFRFSRWNIILLRPFTSPVVLWALQISSANQMPVFASYKVRVDLGTAGSTEFGWGNDQIFKFDNTTSSAVLNNLNMVQELQQHAQTYEGPIQITTSITIYTDDALLGENIV